MKLAPTGWLKCDGAGYLKSQYGNLFNVLVPKYSITTLTIASPCVVTWASHGLAVGDTIYFTTSGALPTGITARTVVYYVIATGLTSTTFQFSATLGGAAVNTSGTQSGVHTTWNALYGLGNGTTSDFNVPDLRGEFIRGWDDARAVDSGRTFGSVQTDAFQGHYHTLQARQDAGMSSRYQNRVLGWFDGGYDTTNTACEAPRTDGTNGAPRIATETRPRNCALLACIKF
jgi:microcystin-dependent protein